MTRISFWQALERIPHLEAVLAEWQQAFGKDFPHAQKFLIPTIKQSLTFPCTNNPACGCYHEVIVHAPDRIVAACRCETPECKRIPLKPKDILVYALDSNRFSQAIQKAFGFSPSSKTTLPASSRKWLVGTYSETYSPVYFLACCSEDDFLKELEELIGNEANPFILLAPSCSFNTPAVQAALQRQKAVLIGLSSVLALTKAGDFTVKQSIQPIMDQFNKGAAEQRNSKYPLKDGAIKPISLPANARWEDLTIQFTDGHNVTIKHKGKSFRRDYKEMGFEDCKNRRPNKQWELLRKLADSHGQIAWNSMPSDSSDGIRTTEQDFGYEHEEDSSEPAANKGFSVVKAPDKLKKSKQQLSKALRAAFQMDTDPFYPYKEVNAYKIRINLIP